MKGLILCLVVFSTSAFAQQQQLDRKDYLIQAVQGQRDDGLAKLAHCLADANLKIEELNKEIASLKAEKEKK